MTGTRHTIARIYTLVTSDVYCVRAENERDDSQYNDSVQVMRLSITVSTWISRIIRAGFDAVARRRSDRPQSQDERIGQRPGPDTGSGQLQRAIQPAAPVQPATGAGSRHTERVADHARRGVAKLQEEKEAVCR